MKKISIKTFSLIGIAALLMTYFAAVDRTAFSAAAPETILDPGSNWIVDKTSYLTGLTIARDGAITAANGRSVTMTVDGVGKEIKAGTYSGKIVLTVRQGVSYGSK
jgi:hypothetical protein